MTQSEHVRGYGYIPDKEDKRDVPLKLTAIRNVLPMQLDLMGPHMPEVWDQGMTGTCTGQSTAAAIKYAYLKEGHTNYANPSRLQLYWQARVIEKTTTQDCGAQIRDVIKGVNKGGVAGEDLWPFDPKKVTVEPPPRVFAVALGHKPVSYAKVAQTEYDLKAALYSGYPVIFGFMVYDYFESREMARTGILKMPEPGQRPIGGHAVLLVGYNDETRMFRVRNSWGSQWGGPLQGYFDMPYDYVLSLKYSSDFWVITNIA